MSKTQPQPLTVIREHPHYYEIMDPLLGDYPLAKTDTGVDGLLADVIDTPLGSRAFDLTQLSKALPHVTIPATEQFHRLGHILGISEFTKRFARREHLQDEELLAYTLYAALSDLAHGPFSHATDIAVQGPGSSEQFHESRVPEALALGGVRKVLEQHKVTTNERGQIEGVKIPSWVESEAPDLCVDRLQYTLHELLLWLDKSSTSEAANIRETLSEIASLKSLEIDENGQLVFTDLEHAKLFAKGYLLLSTEHWNDPVNRVQLYLLIESLKYSILSRRLPGMQDMDNGKTRQPFDYLYAIDSDVLEAMKCEPGGTDTYLFVIENQLADIGREEQKRFVQFRRRIYEQFLMDEQAEEYPSNILHPNLADFGPDSSRFEIEMVPAGELAAPSGHPQVPQLTGENGDLHYLLYPLKNRYIDPLVRAGKNTLRLSDLDPRFALLLKQHQRIQRSSLRVHIPTTKTYRDLLWQQAQEISSAFFAAQETHEPLNKDPKRRGIEAAAERAVQAAISRGAFVDLR